MARALLKQRGVLARYCGEAVISIDRLPKTCRARPTLRSLVRTFGCVAYAKELNQLGKLDDHNNPSIFIGYAESVKPFRILDPVSQRVGVARTIVFDEGHSWDWT